MNDVSHLPRETPEGVVARLAAALGAGAVESPILAFDADGTLWSGDIGNDLFEALLLAGAVRAEARDALAREASEFGIDATGSATEIARGLYRAFLAETYPEERAVEVATWGFAGFSWAEARDFSAQVVAARKLKERIHGFLDPIFQWARREEIPCWVVSASPRFVVEVGAALLGIPASQIVAMTPKVDGRILAELDGPAVYGVNKPRSLFAAHPRATVMGAFGDSSYDADLLAAARVAAAVRPRPGLIARAADVPHMVVLGL